MTDLRSIGDFSISKGHSVSFVLTHGWSHLPIPRAFDARHSLVETEDFWRRWAATCAEAGNWTEPVRRSLITLKGLSYDPTGGIVAAPTTSLPEFIGGTRNWDYRYCWLRDATLTLLALMNAGYRDEA